MSRYYDPKTGRFINADSFEYLDPKAINGLNLYAYCRNNPIMHIDPSGHEALSEDFVSDLLSGVAMIIAAIAYMLLHASLPQSNSSEETNDLYIHFKPVSGELIDVPRILEVTDDGFHVFSWDVFLWKGYLYFDKAENHGIYISLVNLDIFVGAIANDDGPKIGAELDVSAGSAGYDGRYLDIGTSFLGAGLKLLWEDGGLNYKPGSGGICTGLAVGFGFGTLIQDFINVFRQ